MTEMGALFAAVLVAVVVAVASLLGSTSGDGPGTSRTALVIDAAAARDGPDLLDARLGELDADVRVPRTAAEARSDVRYFAAQGHRIVVAGPGAAAAASAAGVPVERTAGLSGALRAVGP